jgi:hypothetical protein
MVYHGPVPWLKREMVYHSPVLWLMVNGSWFSGSWFLPHGSCKKKGPSYNGSVPWFLYEKGMTYHGSGPLVHFLKKGLLYNGLTWFMYEERTSLPWFCSLYMYEERTGLPWLCPLVHV